MLDQCCENACGARRKDLSSTERVVPTTDQHPPTPSTHQPTSANARHQPISNQHQHQPPNQQQPPNSSSLATNDVDHPTTTLNCFGHRVAMDFFDGPSGGTQQGGADSRGPSVTVKVLGDCNYATCISDCQLKVVMSNLVSSWWFLNMFPNA